ncbi:MAG: endonuclease III [Bacteroidales bacterium]|nr:endonuclease III [Bacteroidales bacterium]
MPRRDPSPRTRRTAPEQPPASAARRQTPVPDPDRVQKIRSLLTQLYPETTTALHYGSPFQLAVATILSAQCTDARVNQVTPTLFARYPDAETMAQAELEEIEHLIHSTGFFRAKAKNIQACARQILEHHAGMLPDTLDALVQLPGIGRKTANVILGDAFGIPGIPVDTHVGRLSRRLALTIHSDPVKVEQDLMRWVPQNEWTTFSHRLIFHGRQVCHARKPRCSACVLEAYCPKVGVTPLPHAVTSVPARAPSPQSSQPVRRAQPRSHPRKSPDA